MRRLGRVEALDRTMSHLRCKRSHLHLIAIAIASAVVKRRAPPHDKAKVHRVGGRVHRAWPHRGRRPRTALERWLARQAGPTRAQPCRPEERCSRPIARQPVPVTESRITSGPQPLLPDGRCLPNRARRRLCSRRWAAAVVSAAAGRRCDTAAGVARVNSEPVASPRRARAERRPGLGDPRASACVATGRTPARRAAPERAAETGGR